MKTFCLTIFCFASLVAAEPFPEMPEGPIEKVQAWKILDQQWRIIEPLLFTEAGKAHIGRLVRFESELVTLGKPLVVKTAAGTTASVSRIPKGDVELVRSFRKPPKVIVEGTLTAIDPKTRTLTIKGSGMRPSN